MLTACVAGVFVIAATTAATGAATGAATAGDDAVQTATAHVFNVHVTWSDGLPAEDVALVIERRSMSGTATSAPNRTQPLRTDAKGSASWSLPVSHDDAFVADAGLQVRASYALDALTVERVFTVRSTDDVIRLPERSPEAPKRSVTVEGFVPSVHGFRFRNRFEGYPIPYDGLDHLSIPVAPRTYGLCGGMSLAVIEYFTRERTIPAQTERPSKRDALYQYLYRQQRRSLGERGAMVLKYASWMRLPDTGEDGTQHRTLAEIDAVCAQIDAGNLVLTGLVLADASGSRAIWRNHQVVTYGYEDIGRDAIRLKIYDPNYPGRDDVSIVVQRVPISCAEGSGHVCVPGTLGCSCRMGERVVRGIFKHTLPE